MNKLRQAIFGVADELEGRVLDLVQAVNESIIRSVETVLEAVEEITLTLFAAGFHFVTTIIEEAFNLFGAGLAVVLGAPEEEEENLRATSLGFVGGFDPMELDDLGSKAFDFPDRMSSTKSGPQKEDN